MVTETLRGKCKIIFRERPGPTPPTGPTHTSRMHAQLAESKPLCPHKTSVAAKSVLEDCACAPTAASPLIFARLAAAVETVCTDRSMIERNVLEKIHHSPDYVGVDPETAKADFMSRMLAYENSYEPLGDNELQWASSIHVIDIASGAGTLQVSRIQGYLPGRIVYFLLNAHLSMRPIFFCRHGKSEDNEAGKIGGDSKLSGVGSKFSERLRAFLEALPPHERPCAIWTSTLKRTVMTAAPLHGWPRVRLRRRGSLVCFAARIRTVSCSWTG